MGSHMASNMSKSRFNSVASALEICLLFLLAKLEPLVPAACSVPRSGAGFQGCLRPSPEAQPAMML